VSPPHDYSSGPSDSEFDVPIDILNDSEKAVRAQYLWDRAFKKAKGAAIILHEFGHLHRNILMFGARIQAREEDDPAKR